MLFDALAAEIHRFWRNRPAVAWSLLFTPVAGLVLSVFGSLFLKQRIAAITEARLPAGLDLTGRLDLGESLIDHAAGLAHPALLLFVLIGAAVIFAGDYRWETWRLISARNSRANLILAKVGAVKVLSLAAVLLLLLSGLAEDLLKAFIFHRPLAFALDGGRAADAGLLTLAAYVRVVQVMLLGLLAAVVTRSLLAALFVPLAVTVGQTLLGGMIPLFGWTPDDWPAQALLPGLAHDTLKAAILGGADAPRAATVWLAAASLAGWCMVPLAAALAWFRRQDLSKE